MRDYGESDENRTLAMEVQGSRRRGRPKTRWKDCIAADMREKSMAINITGDRGRSRKLTKTLNASEFGANMEYSPEYHLCQYGAKNRTFTIVFN
ncbi:hypothetical protein SK128_015603 [Halocaridina rubra]|uniref:Uncharacterized protein n=1 Tax=Halocaridina rubra TaxID=373956 RepID=A0AAN8WNP0_HALRR